ncbi:MAG: hypothetical protein NVSMB3_08270 [Acidobacteriaceae bacterium]
MSPHDKPDPISAGGLRRELSARNLVRAEALSHEKTFGTVASVLYAPDDDGVRHGNFVTASYRRICTHPEWKRRLLKTYTGGRQVARRHDRWRGELDCANSSDALLMNLFCYPGFTHRPGVCRLLGIASGARPKFGVRVQVSLANGRVDRTEVDMELGDLLVEAKLTETGFQQARPALLERYRNLGEIFYREELPRAAGGEDAPYLEYQLLRGVLAANAREQGFLVLCDGRRAGMVESWFRVIRAIRHWELRDRMRLLTWQELSAESPAVLQDFLATKYGIYAGREAAASKGL